MRKKMEAIADDLRFFDAPLPPGISGDKFSVFKTLSHDIGRKFFLRKDLSLKFLLPKDLQTQWSVKP